MTKIISFLLLIFLIIFSACNKNNSEADAYGNFEATETIVSSEVAGKILSLNVEEGQELKAGQIVGYIDSIQLALRKAQLIASRKSISSRRGNVSSQANVFEAQLQNLFKEKRRIENLLKDKAAAPKQLDDINAQILIVQKQIASTETQNPSISAELKSMNSQIEQIDDQLQRCVIRSPINGIVLAKYAENYEVTGVGKPIFKIADMKNMILRVYVSGNQLTDIKTGQKVKVLIDEKESSKTLEGEISWIASNAEFTPKIIQTKEERVNLVYAVKVRVNNKNGLLKIGMPGEIKL
jgi:HlyD family secretion protein